MPLHEKTNTGAVRKTNKKTCKTSLLGRTALYSALICSLQLAPVSLSYADDFIGSGDGGSAGTSGSDFSGTVPDGTYEKIYGGYLTSGDKAVQNNTLTLTDKHTGSEIFGGCADDEVIGGTEGSATATRNTVSFTGGTCTNYVGGGTAYIMSTGKAAADANTVSIANVKFTDDKSEIYGGYSFAYYGGTASANNNSLTASYTADSTIMTVYGGYSFAYQGATTYDGSGTATASYNGLGEKQDGTLTNVSCEKFAGGIAYAVTADAKAEAVSNKFILSGKSYGDIYGGQANAGDSGHKKHQDDKSIATASSNELTITAEEITGDVYGGKAQAIGKREKEEGATADSLVSCIVTADSNSLTITKTGTGYTSKVCGGYAFVEYAEEGSSASASKNILNIKEGSYYTITGGKAIIGDGESNAGGAVASENAVSLTNANLLNADVYGGYAKGYTASAEKNSLTIKNDKDTGAAASRIYGGYATYGEGSATASNNGIGEKRDGTLTNVSSELFVGGYAEALGGRAEAQADSNNFALSGSSYGDVLGGYALAGRGHNKTNSGDQQSVATASGNTLTVEAQDITNEALGGSAYADGDRVADGNNVYVRSTAVANDNTLSVKKTGTSVTKTVYGGKAQVRLADSESSASASGNVLDMQDGAYTTIYGGYAVSDTEKSTVTASFNGQGTKKDKTGTLSGVTADTFNGGYASTVNGNAEASENKFSLTSSTIATVTGGTAVVEKGESEAGKAVASGNNLTFSNGTVADMYGGFAEGYAAEVSVNTNVVVISDSTCTGTVLGASAASYASQEISADDNSVKITDVKFTGEKAQVYGGKSFAHRGGTASASRNSLTITNSADSSITEIYGGYALSYQGGSTYEGSGTATASDNGLESQDGTLTNVSCDTFAGGFAYAATADATAKADRNNFTLNGKTFGSIYGGQALAGDSGNKIHDGDKSVATASDNTLTITAEEITGDVYGGTAQAFGKRAKEEGDEADPLVSCTVTADSNTLTITKTGTGTSGDVYGGLAYAEDGASGSTASAQENNLDIKAGSYGTIYTGYAVLGAEGTAKASSNTGNVNATAECYTGALAAVSGGTAEASDNESFIHGSYGTATGSQAVVTDGKSTKDTATASGNTLMLDNAEVSGVVYGAIAEASSAGQAVTEGNTVTLANGSVFKDEIYAGRSIVSDETGTASSHGNTVNILNSENAVPTFDKDKTVIWGGYAKAGDKEQASWGNTLSLVNVKGMTAANIRNFGSFKFYLPDMQAEETVLTLTGNEADDKKGTTFIADAETSRTTVQVLNKVINVTGANGGEFRSGEKIYLLANKNGLTAQNITLYDSNQAVTTTVKGQTGISLQYDLLLEADGTSLYLTRARQDNPVVLPETKPIAEGAASGLALASESANAAVELLRDFSLTAGSITPFAHVQASSMRHETGSHINVTSVSLAAGLGTGFETGAGNLSVGAFFEYGRGSYTTHNSFDSRSDVDGDGNSWYMGGGILAKMDFVKTGPGHFYLEGSAHMGSLHNEFDSNSIEYRGRIAQFDMDSPYYSLHGGLGYVWNITEEHDLDVYGKYMWTRLQGTDDTLTTSDRFEYDDMDSNRIRLGARYTYKGSERFRPYAGAAFEHEFAGSCESAVFDHSVSAPSFEGSSGMGEIGLMMQPSESLPLSVNLGVQGYVGQKRGISGNCNVMYEF